MDFLCGVARPEESQGRRSLPGGRKNFVRGPYTGSFTPRFCFEATDGRGALPPATALRRRDEARQKAEASRGSKSAGDVPENAAGNELKRLKSASSANERAARGEAEGARRRTRQRPQRATASLTSSRASAPDARRRAARNEKPGGAIARVAVARTRAAFAGFLAAVSGKPCARNGEKATRRVSRRGVVAGPAPR